MTDATKAEIRIDQALESHPVLRGKNLKIQQDERKIVVEGDVQSYYQKQLVQEVIRRVDGIEEIENRLFVVWFPEADAKSLEFDATQRH